jgi:excisionase family DNA binding protein
MTDGYLMTAREVAEFTGFSEGTIRHWVSQGRIPYVRFSARCVRFLRSDIENWILQKAVVPHADGQVLRHLGKGNRTYAD